MRSFLWKIIFTNLVFFFKWNLFQVFLLEEGTTLEKIYWKFHFELPLSPKVNVKDVICLVDACRSTPVTLEENNIDFFLGGG